MSGLTGLSLQQLIEANRHNITALHTIVAPAWVSSPDFRGTINIVWSCLLTLFACIYTALHLNVPQEPGTWPRLVAKGRWVLGALLCPELVLYVAASQLLEARALQRDLRVEYRKALPEGATQPPVDLKFCFFIIMGGLQVPITDILPSRGAMRTEWGLGVKKLTLSSYGVLNAAKLGHFINIPKEKIDDKSKANILQKALVLAQITWMVVQCCLRAANGFPIALLEVHTMVHVVCAIALYVCWLQKPLDVTDPELLDAQEHEDVLAFLVQQQFCRDQNGQFTIYAEQELAGIAESEISQYVVPDWTKSDFAILGPGKCLPCGMGCCVGPRASTWPMMLTLGDATRAARVVRFLKTREGPTMGLVRDYSDFSAVGNQSAHRQDERSFQRPLNIRTKANTDLLYSPPKDILDHFNFFTGGLEFFSEDLRRLVLSVVLPILYGGIHLSVWNYEFPTLIESQLWKGACFVITASMTVIVLTMRVTGGSGFISSFPVLALFSWIVGIPVIIVVLLASRLYIVVESFLSLRRVPIGVYWIPSAVQMVPHF